jgi:hypothetical protein
MNVNNGRLQELTEEDLKKVRNGKLKELVEVKKSDMTKKQFKEMKVSKHDNKSVLGKSWTEIRKSKALQKKAVKKALKSKYN